MTTPNLPPSLPDPRDDDIVAVLRTAVDETARPLLQLTESPSAQGIVQIQAAFRAAIAPIHQALDQRATAEPDSDLAGTMRHLHDAFTHFERGNLSTGKALLVRARAALATVKHPHNPHARRPSRPPADDVAAIFPLT